MSRLRLAAALAAVCLTCTSLASARPQGGGSISGKVAVAGKPAAGIAVALLRDHGSSADAVVARTATDAEGRYRFSALEVGHYRIAAHAPAFTGDVSDVRPFAGKGVVVGAGEEVTGVDIALEPGGVITGRVSDTSGRPVVEERVSIFAVLPSGEIREAERMRWRMAMTDDRGVYRVWGLAPGRYVVGVGDPPGQQSRSRGRARQGYERTYHPNAVDHARATVVDLAPGGEAAGVDIVVGEPVPRFTISGVTVEEASGAPVANVQVGYVILTGGHMSSAGRANTPTGDDGRFQIMGLPAGTYSLLATSDGERGLLSDMVEVVVSDRDPEPLTLRMGRGVALTGELVLDGAAPAPERELRLYAFRRPEGPDDHSFYVSRMTNTRVGPDGSFAFGGLKPGRYLFYVTIGGRVPQRIPILRLEQNGVEVEEVDLTAGQPAEMRVVAALGAGAVRGRVKTRGEGTVLPGQMRISINVPGTTRSVAAAVADERGEFLVEQIPEGAFELVVDASGRAPDGKGAMYGSEPLPVRISGSAPVEVEVELDLDKPREGAR